MREIDEALDGRLDYLFVATSTTGTAARLRRLPARERPCSTRLVAVDSSGQRALRRSARHAAPAGLRRRRRDDALRRRRVRRPRARLRPRLRVGCRRLAAREAILAGASSGGVAFALAAARRRHAARQPLRRDLPGRRQRLPRDGLRRRLGRARARLRRRRGSPTLRGEGSLRIAARAFPSPRAPGRRAVAAGSAVGLGPKGLFALERLLDHACRLDPEARLAVDLFEPHPRPGAGPVYDPAQPDYLRMNFAAGQLDMWWPSQPRGATAGSDSRSWRGAARRRRGCLSAPRRGRALSRRRASKTLLRHAPPNVDVRLTSPPRRARGARCPTRRPARIVLRRGADRRPRRPTRLLAARLDARAPLVPRLPVRPDGSRAIASPGATVAIRGFALTFIDAALALTEGRGGSFEPLIIRTGSAICRGQRRARSDPPVHPHGPAHAGQAAGVADGTRPALGRIAADGRARIADLGGTVDLHADLLPILADDRRARTSPPQRVGTIDAALRIAVGRRLAEAPEASATSLRSTLCRRSSDPCSWAPGSHRPIVAWALGHTWRTLYPAIVARLGGDGLAGSRLARVPPPGGRDGADRVRPSRDQRRQAARTRRSRPHRPGTCAARRSSARGRAHRLRSPHGARAVDVAIDAVLPGPGALGRRRPRGRSRRSAGMRARRARQPRARGRARRQRAGDATARSPAGCRRSGGRPRTP